MIASLGGAALVPLVTQVLVVLADKLGARLSLGHSLGLPEDRGPA
jgi:hypothetical protein